MDESLIAQLMSAVVPDDLINYEAAAAADGIEIDDLKDAIHAVANSCRRERNFARAHSLYTYAIMRWNTQEARRGVAETAQAEENWAIARDLWEEYSQIYPQDFWGKYFFADMTARAGNLEKSLEMLLEISNDANRSTVLTRMIEIHLENNNGLAAHAIFNELNQREDKPSWRMNDLVAWIVQVQLANGPYPPRLFNLDKTLVDLVRYDRLRK